ncbi:hypothetical protein F4680DRAFT_442434 [Xylaria scruposa]|nr:hypothetical protein F4680DRAFT_442434 [Xylaria scruposa]
MSLPDHYTSGSRSSLRRSACDRCRSMKLKCMRDSNYPQTCLRCMQTAVHCLTGPAKPLGRAARAAASPAREPPNYQEPEIPNTSTSSADVDILGVTFNNSDHLVSCSGQFDNMLLDPDRGVEESLGPDSMDCSPTVMENTIMHIPEIYGNEGSISSSQCTESRNIDIYDAQNTGLQFCRLNLTLSEQLLFFTTHLLGDTLEDTTCDAESEGSSQSTPICKVLGLTFEFVSNLRHYLSLQQPSTHTRHQNLPSASLWSTAPSLPPTPTMGSADGSSSTSFFSAPWLFGSPSDSVPSPVEVTITPTATSAGNKVELSVVAIPNILSCYLHLVAIFGVFFRHMHTFLRQTPASFLPKLQTVPGLWLADMQVDHGGLQLKILIQVIEHQLVTMETVLGLPDEHRVFPRRQERQPHDDDRGIRVGGCEIGMLLTDVMGSTVAASAMQIIASLREEMAKVRQLL